MKNQPVVVVRRRRGNPRQSVHGGAWKIAYADFMTAMMAFFLVMWLLSIASPQELTTIAEYFRTPLATALTGGARSSDDSSPIPGGGDDPTRQQGDVHKSIDQLVEKLEKKRLNQLRERLDQLIESDPRLRVLRPQLLINMVSEGLQIQILDSQNRPMFETGSALVEPYMRDVLRGIAPILNDIPNKISISGHTDSTPYANGERGYSNWELSADRANASRRELITGGLAEGKILRVVGMASTMSLVPQQPDAAINRRISLLVLNKQTEEMIEHENAVNPKVDVNRTGDLLQQPAFSSATGGVPSPSTPANAAPSSPASVQPSSPTQPDSPASTVPFSSAQPALPAGGAPSSSTPLNAAPSSPASAQPSSPAQPDSPASTVPSSSAQPALPAGGAPFSSTPANAAPSSPASAQLSSPAQPDLPAGTVPPSSAQPAAPVHTVPAGRGRAGVSTAITPAPDARTVIPAGKTGAGGTAWRMPSSDTGPVAVRFHPHRQMNMIQQG